MKTSLANRSSAPQGQRGFTLADLITVLCLLCLLGVLAATGLATSRPGAGVATCFNNLRQLTAAWHMYADDNRGRLVYNQEGPSAGRARGQESWVAGSLAYESLESTNTAMLVDHEQYPYGAFLGPYVRTPVVFKCPADPSRMTVEPRLPFVRSVSMNSYVGDKTRTWTDPSAYQLYGTIGSIARPQPSELFVLTDERCDSINDGKFQVDADTPGRLINFPGAHHNGSGSFSFADGHVAGRRWLDPRTVPPLRDFPLATGSVLSGNVDVLWIQQHATARK